MPLIVELGLILYLAQSGFLHCAQDAFKGLFLRGADVAGVEIQANILGDYLVVNYPRSSFRWGPSTTLVIFMGFLWGQVVHSKNWG